MLPRLAGLAALAPGARQDPGTEPTDAAAWDAAQAAPEGSAERAALVRAALERTDGPLADERLRLVWEEGVHAARALRLDDAIAIQAWLARRHPAEWSAMDLALSLGQAGQTEEADRVLAAQIARAERAGEPTAALWSRRGILWLGAGDERLGRDHLGRALARGSGDASIVLALADLHEARFARARAGFRARLHDEPPGAWALRGWGLSLLPAEGRGGSLRPLPPEESDR